MGCERQKIIQYNCKAFDLSSCSSFGLINGRMRLPPTKMEKTATEAGLGKIQLLSFTHVKFEVSISHLNRDVTKEVEYTNLEPKLAYRLKPKRLE